MRQLTREQVLKDAARYGGAAFAAAAGGGALAHLAEAAVVVKPSGTITVWQHQSTPFITFFQKMSDTYEAQTGVKVENLYIPFADFQTKVLTAYSAGTGPDVVKLPGELFPFYVSKGLFAEVNPKGFGRKTAQALQKYKFARRTLDYFAYNNKYYGVPNDVNNELLFYRMDDFEEVGLDPHKPPTTWSEVVRYGKRLTKLSGGTITRAGYQPPYQGFPIWDFLQILPLIEGQGGRLISPDGKKTQLASKEGIYALDLYADFARKYKIASTSLTHPRYHYGLMSEGKASMLVQASFAGAVMNLLSGGKVAVGENVGVAPVPRFKKRDPVTSGYLWGWGVNAKSKNPATAWHFLNSILTKRHANTQLAAASTVQPIQGFDKFPAAVGNPRIAPIIEVMSAQLPYTSYVPRIIAFNQLQELLSDAVQSVVEGKASSTQAAKDFDAQMVKVLRS